MKKLGFISDSISHKYSCFVGFRRLWIKEEMVQRYGIRKEEGYSNGDRHRCQSDAESIQGTCDRGSLLSQDEAREEQFFWSPGFRYSGSRILRNCCDHSHLLQQLWETYTFPSRAEQPRGSVIDVAQTHHIMYSNMCTHIYISRMYSH